MRAGAYDFLEKPFAPERLVEVATRAMEKRALSAEVLSLRLQLAAKSGIEATLLGRSAAVQLLQRQVQQLAATNCDVMIVGETGTGKELVARAIPSPPVVTVVGVTDPLPAVTSKVTETPAIGRLSWSRTRTAGGSATFPPAGAVCEVGEAA